MPDAELLAEAESRLGRVLEGRWTLTRLLGVGAVAAVYEARDRDGERVAVEVIHETFARDRGWLERFLREGSALSRTGHPGFASVLDDGVGDDGRPFRVVELVDGEPVEEQRAREGGRLPLEQVLRLAERLLDALAVAHDRGIVHRDLRPDRLFLALDGTLKVLDFGTARSRELAPPGAAGTPAGAPPGTPAFLPPEQARARWDRVDARTDLWAAGATMFTLLCGEHVHPGETPREQLGLAMTAPARSLAAVRPDLPRAVVDLVDRALMYRPEDRWQSAREMQLALRAAYESTEGAPLASAPTAAADPLDRRR